MQPSILLSFSTWSLAVVICVMHRYVVFMLFISNYVTHTDIPENANHTARPASQSCIILSLRFMHRFTRPSVVEVPSCGLYLALEMFR